MQRAPPTRERLESGSQARESKHTTNLGGTSFTCFAAAGRNGRHSRAGAIAWTQEAARTCAALLRRHGWNGVYSPDNGVAQVRTALPRRHSGTEFVAWTKEARRAQRERGSLRKRCGAAPKHQQSATRSKALGSRSRPQKQKTHQHGTSLPYTPGGGRGQVARARARARTWGEGPRQAVVQVRCFVHN